MRSARSVLYGSALICGALAVACSDALGPSITAVDDLFAELDHTWLTSTNPVSVSPGITHLTTRPSASACDYSVATSSFVCPTRVQNGLTSTTTYQLFDAAHVPQPAFLRHGTDAVHIVTNMSGALPTMSGSTTTLTAHVDENLSGLTSGTHTLNGTATSSFTTTGATPGTYSMVETTSNLLLADPSQTNPYPSSGTITTLIYAGLPVPAGLVSTVTATFDGTRSVTLVIVTGSLTQTCMIDLKGTAAPVCS